MVGEFTCGFTGTVSPSLSKFSWCNVLFATSSCVAADFSFLLLHVCTFPTVNPLHVLFIQVVVMSLPAPREEKESAHQTVEELIKLQLSISREDMENGIQPISPIMSYCIFNVERMAPPSLGLPVYSGLDPASLLLQSVVEHTILNKQFFGLLDGILRDPSRSCAINECVDKTILDLTKQNFSKYQLAQRV